MVKTHLRTAQATIAIAPLLLTVPAYAQVSLIRFMCEGDSVGAEVSINGKFKGECPFDASVPPGTVQLRAVKKIDAEHERVFEQEFRMGEGSAKRVEVLLGPARLNAEGMRREAERKRLAQEEAQRREEARQLALADERRRDAEVLVQQQKAADAGDPAAMLALGDRYARGSGVEKSEAQANAWYERAKAGGNEGAAFKLTPYYRNGKTEDVDDVARILSLPVEQKRDIMLNDEAAIRAFVESDRFFATPGGGQAITFYPKFIEGLQRTDTCRGGGPIARIESRGQYQNIVNSSQLEGVLGGITYLAGTSAQSLFQTTRIGITEIKSVYGQPFPLVAGKRFGFSYVMSRAGQFDGVTQHELACAAGKETSAGIPVACVEKENGIPVLRRFVWHEAAACFALLSITVLQ